MRNVESSCAIIRFECMGRVRRMSAIRQVGKSAKIMPLIKRSVPVQEQRALPTSGRSTDFDEWADAISLRTSAARRVLGLARSDAEFAVAGLIGALERLGIRGTSVPETAAASANRSLSYRIPNDGWQALHQLDFDVQDGILLAMLEAIHNGRVQRRSRRAIRPESGHALLPMELSGEEVVGREARVLMRLLPCFGLDRGVSNPSDYGVIFAYEGEGAVDSLCYEPLMARYREVRSKFVKENGLGNTGDLTKYVMAYGCGSELLDLECSEMFGDREFVGNTVRHVLERGPSWDISEW